jgi:hypothetical protein
MVPLTEVGTAFEAQLLAARLGAAGILSQVRGAIDGPYPVGSVAVLVEGTQLAEARELLLGDEVDEVFEPVNADPTDGVPTAPAWALATPFAKTCLVVACIVLLAAAVFGALSMLI